MDTAQALLDFLQHHEAAAPIRELVYGNILEAGKLTSKMLQDWHHARVQAEATGTILAVTVHDTGDARVGAMMQEWPVVRLYDMQNGNDNLRVVREALLELVRKWFEHSTLSLDERSLLILQYRGGRTGFRRSPEYAADFEAIPLVAEIVPED